MPAPTEILNTKLVARTTDQALLTRLIKKCEEYRTRMADPTDPIMQLDAYYKYGILNPLLVHGVINVDEIWESFTAQKSFNKKAFENALGVIVDYNSGNLSNINPETGTGLT